MAIQRFGLNSRGDASLQPVKRDEQARVSGWSRLASKATTKEVIAYKNGGSYDGHVNKEGQRHGEGILIFPGKKVRFHGVFEFGAMTKGTINYSKAAVETHFTGTFKDNQWYVGKLVKGTTTYELSLIHI